MATIVDMLITKQAQAELDKSIASLKLMHEEIIKINQTGLNINGNTAPRNPADLNNLIRQNEELARKYRELEEQLAIGDIIEIQSEEFAGGRVTYMENAKRQSITQAHCKEIVFAKSIKGKFLAGEKVYKLTDLQLNKTLQRS